MSFDITSTDDRYEESSLHQALIGGEYLASRIVTEPLTGGHQHMLDSYYLTLLSLSLTQSVFLSTG
jgi:hypothetical protein